MKTIDNNKLMEIVEECFRVIKAQNKVISDNNIEIEALKLKLSIKPQVEIKEVKDNMYRENVTKLFVNLKNEQMTKDDAIEELKTLIKSKDEEIDRLNYYNKCRDIFKNGGLMG